MGEYDERDARESSLQPGRRLRRGKVTSRRETSKETGRKETGTKETGEKKTTGAKERGVGGESSEGDGGWGRRELRRWE